MVKKQTNNNNNTNGEVIYTKNDTAVRKYQSVPTQSMSNLMHDYSVGETAESDGDLLFAISDMTNIGPTAGKTRREQPSVVS